MEPAIRAWLAQVTEPELARLNYVEELMKTSTKTEIRLAPPRVDVAPSADAASFGPSTAPVQLVVFGDFLSPEYVRLARAFGRVRDTFGSRLRLNFRHLPTRGAISEIAAQAAECARRQDRFWEFHDAVVTSPGFLDTARLKQIAGETGLARQAFDVCLDQDQSREVVTRAGGEAARYAITASPGVLVNGAMAPDPPPFLPPFEYLQRLIEEELARLAKAKPAR
jgi:protein-disulfide isomerase